jgi:CubicO group peptidase (beta-lactamase class C family)
MKTPFPTRTSGAGLLLLVVALLRPALTAAIPPPPPEVAEAVRQWLADPTTKAPGIAVAAVNASGFLWSGAFGLADVAQKRPATPATRWQMASITKVYTTLVLAQLAHEGRIELDAPLTRYLPEFQPRFPEPGAPLLTLRRLANHTSGFTNGWGEPNHSYSLAQLLAWIRAAGLTAQPGLQYQYSNTGFSLLGGAMERATGQPYADLLRDRVLRPLHLDASGLTTLPPHADLATSYWLQEGKLVPRAASPLFDAQTPASSLVSTVEDIGRFAQAHLAEGPTAPIPDAVKDRLFTATVPAGDATAIGLGWHYTWRENLPYWYHIGAWNYFYSRIVVRPDVVIGLVLSTNGPWTRDLIAPLLRILAAQADTRRLDALAGDYVDPAGKVFTVLRPPGPELMLELAGVGRLLPLSRHTFRVPTGAGNSGSWIRFVSENGKQVMLWDTRQLVRRE